MKKQKRESVLFKIKKYFFVCEDEVTLRNDKQEDDARNTEYNEYLKYYLRATRWQNC